MNNKTVNEMNTASKFEPDEKKNILPSKTNEKSSRKFRYDID